MASLGDLIVRVGADVRDFTGGMQQVNRELEGAKSAIDRQIGGFQKLGSALMGIGTTLTASVTAPLAAFGTAAVISAAQMEQMQVALTTMLGSAQRARDMLAALADLAARTPNLVVHGFVHDTGALFHPKAAWFADHGGGGRRRRQSPDEPRHPGPDRTGHSRTRNA